MTPDKCQRQQARDRDLYQHRKVEQNKQTQSLTRWQQHWTRHKAIMVKSKLVNATTSGAKVKTKDH